MTPTLILTRPKAQSESFAAAITKRWAGPIRIIISPLMQIVSVDARLPALDSVIFTSVNGVAAAHDLGLPRGTRAWCVGERTAQVAQDAGFAAITGPGDAEGLIKLLLRDPPTGRLAHLRGQYTQGDVSARLNAAQINCVDVVVYDQRACRLSKEARAALAGDKPVVIPLFSPRSSTILSEQGPFVAPVHAVAISDAVRNATVQSADWHVTVADRPDAQAMQDATLATLRALYS